MELGADKCTDGYVQIVRLFTPTPDYGRAVYESAAGTALKKSVGVLEISPKYI